MKLLIAGSRSFDHCDPSAILEIISTKVTEFRIYTLITEVVSGCARGIDTHAITWANLNHYSVKRFPADWNSYGKAAGPMRNLRMAEYADQLLAIWDQKSRGTWDMVNKMLVLNKPVHLVTADPESVEWRETVKAASLRVEASPGDDMAQSIPKYPEPLSD